MSDITARLEALPCWSAAITWERLHGGLSNESFKVTSGGASYVARFGQDFPFHHVFREREAMTARAAAAAGLAPEVIYSGPGVLVCRFIEAKTYDAAAVRANLDRVGDLVAQFHQALPARVSGPGFMFWVFHVIRDYARTLEAGGSRMTGRLPEFLALNSAFEAAQVPLPIVFGHNDLLPGNILDDGARLWLIDFEYAGFSTALFDLAGVASNAGFSSEESTRLLTRYFGAAPDPAILQAQAAMQCASLLRETLWSLVSELHIDIPENDYLAYTEQNLAAFEESLESYRSRYGQPGKR
ncbi:MAG: choline kinase family protein [Pseudomonadota bacterium]